MSNDGYAVTFSPIVTIAVTRDGTPGEIAVDWSGSVESVTDLSTREVHDLVDRHEIAEAAAERLDDVLRNWRIVMREIDRRAEAMDDDESFAVMQAFDSYRTEHGEDALDFVRAMIGPLD